MLVKAVSGRVESAHAKMNASRAATANFLHQLFHHATPVAVTLGARQQINVQMGRIVLVRFGTEIIRMMVAMMNMLDARPAGRIALRVRKLGTKRRPPFGFVTMEKVSRV